MQTRTDQTHSLSPVDSFEIRNGRRTSIGELVRQWGPYVLTVLVVPGGIAIALVLLWARWNQRRLAVQSQARA